MLEARIITADELLAMGEGRRELVAGRVVEMSPAGFRHSAVAVNVSRALADWARKTGAGMVCGADGGFRLSQDPDTVRAPDAAFVAAARLEGVDATRFLPFAPDLAVEVVSPGDSFREVEERGRMWFAHGARAVWVVEPEQRLLFVYRADSSRVVFREGDTVSGDEILPGFTLPVAECF